MESQQRTAVSTMNRRHFIRNAATAAGAVALPGTALAGQTLEAHRLQETPASAAAWKEFQQHLAEALSDLAEDEYLVIDDKRTHRFVQFMAQGRHGVRAEAVSNAFLTPAAHLSKDTTAALLSMGWHAPTYEMSDVDVEPADGSPNFFLDVAAPVPHGELVALAVATLRDHYGVRHPGELQYMGKSTSDDSVSIRFPSLRLKRAPAMP